jgi:quinoprotein glucose dehydrogenase
LFFVSNSLEPISVNGKSGKAPGPDRLHAGYFRSFARPPQTVPSSRSVATSALSKLTRLFMSMALLEPILSLGTTPALAAGKPSARPYTTWSQYEGTPDASQYSALSQVNRSNVKQLHVAWRYSTGDTNDYQFNPLVVDDVMYVMARHHSIVALNAVTGKELWVHPVEPEARLITHRGINYWESADRSDRRLLFAANNELQEIDAKTGKSILSFGTNGCVDLREGLGRDPESLSLVQSTTPGRVFRNLIILGSATNEEYRSGPGDIRAYDVLSGRLVWSFHTIPHPGEPGYDTWPKNAWKTVGGANAWSGMSLDDQRGILYVPTASPKYNFYGADRTGADLFGDCLLALDAQTGKLIWYFQMVHHDIWDYDNATAPALLTVRHNGKPVDVVAEANKEGFVWVFDRANGKPLWPIQERPVPSSDMPGEVTSPTQPFPTVPPPFARQAFTVQDLNPFMSREERAQFANEVANARNQGLFTPPGLQNTVEMPGNNGGANFGGAAADPAHGFLYVVSKDLPCMLRLQPVPAESSSSGGSPEQRGRSVFDANCALCHGGDLAGKPPATPSLVNLGARFNRDEVRAIIQHGKGPMPAFSAVRDQALDALLTYLFHPEKTSASGKEASPTNPASPSHAQGAEYKSSFGFMFTSSGLPAIAPPWTTLTAYDLNSGTIRWSIPLGDVPELAAEGHGGTGADFSQTGPVLTAGGLLFTGTRDRKVRAFDSRNGKLLWEATLDAGLEGIPAVYQVNGKEYIVFCAAERATTYTHNVPGHPASRSPIPGAYVAFALP